MFIIHLNLKNKSAEGSITRAAMFHYLIRCFDTVGWMTGRTSGAR